MGSRVFDGVDDYLQAVGAIVDNPPFTLAAWVKPANVTANHTIVGVSDIDTDTRYHNLRFTGGTAGDPVQAISRNTSSGVSASASGFVADVWQHVAGVWTSFTDRLVYLGGTAGTTNTTNLDPPTPDTTYVGRLSRLAPTDYAAGKIAVVAVWNIALSGADIATLAGGTLPTSVQAANLIAYWPMMSGMSPEPDDIGTLDLTVNGTTFDSGDTPPVGGASPVLSRIRFASLLGVS